MFKRGDIVLVDFNPVKGHEQGNFRPALVLNDMYLPSGINLVCPITTKKKSYPLEVELDNRTKTQGVILCFQIRAVDLNNRNAKLVEQLPKDLLDKTIEYIKRILDYTL